MRSPPRTNTSHLRQESAGRATPAQKKCNFMENIEVVLRRHESCGKNASQQKLFK
jgi:hypothetical protein